MCYHWVVCIATRVRGRSADGPSDFHRVFLFSGMRGIEVQPRRGSCPKRRDRRRNGLGNAIDLAKRRPVAKCSPTIAFPQHRHFGFELVDSSVWCITVLGQRFARVSIAIRTMPITLSTALRTSACQFLGSQGLGLIVMDFVRHGDDPKSPTIPDSRRPHVMWRT